MRVPVLVCPLLRTGFQPAFTAGEVDPKAIVIVIVIGLELELELLLTVEW